MRSNYLSLAIGAVHIFFLAYTHSPFAAEPGSVPGQSRVKFESLDIRGKIEISEPSDPLGESLMISADIRLGQGSDGIEPAEEEITLYFMIPEIPSGFIVIPAGALEGSRQTFESNESLSPAKLGIRVLRRDEFEKIVDDLSGSLNFFNVRLTLVDELGLLWNLQIEAAATSDIINPTFLPLGGSYITNVTIGDDTGSSTIHKSR